MAAVVAGVCVSSAVQCQSLDKSPASFTSGQDSTMWDIIEPHHMDTIRSHQTPFIGSQWQW